jgi:heptaprenyl diphosphate synthase
MRKRLEGKSVKTAYLGLLLALAVICGYIEALIPVPVPIPGMKLGLANLVIAAVLYLYGPVQAMTVTLLRVLIIGFLFGNMFSIIYSLSGAAVSLIAMALLKRTGAFGIIGVSALGGVMHNVSQVLVAVLILEGFPWRWYLPVLMLAGLFAGILVGFADRIVLPRIYAEGDY